MAEIVLALVVVALVVERAIERRRGEAERSRLVDAVVAKNAAEYAGLRAVAEPAKPRAPRRHEDSDFQVGS